MISVEQMRMLHALARQVGEGHEHILAPRCGTLAV